MTYTISFRVSAADAKVIRKIAVRAQALLKKHNPSIRTTIQHWAMNVTACHANGNPIRLHDLLEADDFNFAHDVFGIDRHISRETGQLLNHFSPRFSSRQVVSA
jgi:hypothetical protein